MRGPRPAIGMLAAGATVTVAFAAPGAEARPLLRTAHGCYLVGAPVQVSGRGFAPRREFDLTDDGVDFGQATSSSSGTFTVRFRPGGLPRGVAQHVEHLDASDGTASAQARFTLSLPAGAGYLARTGRARTLRAPFEVWGFSLTGVPRAVFVHYLAPSGRVGRTLALGRTHGQCGHLRTGPRRLFPFSPSRGRWTLQLDTSRRYSPRPGGPVARIRVRVGHG